MNYLEELYKMVNEATEDEVQANEKWSIDVDDSDVYGDSVTYYLSAFVNDADLPVVYINVEPEINFEDCINWAEIASAEDDDYQISNPVDKEFINDCIKRCSIKYFNEDEEAITEEQVRQMLNIKSDEEFDEFRKEIIEDAKLAFIDDAENIASDIENCPDKYFDSEYYEPDNYDNSDNY